MAYVQIAKLSRLIAPKAEKKLTEKLYQTTKKAAAAQLGLDVTDKNCTNIFFSISRHLFRFGNISSFSAFQVLFSTHIPFIAATLFSYITHTLTTNSSDERRL